MDVFVLFNIKSHHCGCYVVLKLLETECEINATNTMKYMKYHANNNDVVMPHVMIYFRTLYHVANGNLNGM